MSSAPSTPNLVINAARAELLHLKHLTEQLGSRAPETRKLDALVRRPRVGVGAVLLAASRPGCVLVGERLGSHGAGRWALPGGHLEFLASFEECASAEVGEEVGLALPPARFLFTGVATNDPMPAEDLHYVTLFAAALLTEEEAAAVANVEPDKCAGWGWKEWAELRAGGVPIFAPLRRFIDVGGPEKAAALFA